VTKVTQVKEKIYLIEETDYKEHCNCFLIVGSASCMVVDFGIGLIDWEAILNKYAPGRKVIPVLTHFHFDHVGGSSYFDNILANIESFQGCLALQYFSVDDLACDVPSIGDLNQDQFCQVCEDDCIEFDEFSFKILYTPGHDPTSISLHDESNGILITGDLMYDGQLIHDLPDSDLSAYIESLKKIGLLDAELILPGHNGVIGGF